MKSSRVGRPLALAIGVLTCLALLVASSAVGARTAARRSNRLELAGSHPSWAAADRLAGAVPAAHSVSARVWLAPRHAAQLDRLARAISNPASSHYRKFISRAQYTASFAPTAAQVAAVKHWLAAAGLRITATGPDHHYVAVRGSAAAVGMAFGTRLGRYSVKGSKVRAPMTNLSIPRSVAGSVLAVTGLTRFGHRMRPADLGAPAAFVNGTPCSSYYGQRYPSDLPKFKGRTLPWNPCGYVPSQLRGAYGEGASGPVNLGKGATVAITDAFDASTLEEDANTYSLRHGDPKFAKHQFQDRSFPEPPPDDPNVVDCGGNDWYGEQALDVEAAHGMAPGANVLYYGASSCFDDDLLASLSKVVHDNKASIVTNSWGSPTFFIDENGDLVSTVDDDLINAYESIFKQGAVQGIGFYFSSGDDGDDLDAYGYKHPEFPTGDPWVTSVGGTSLAVNRDDRRSFETGWGTAKWDLSDNGKSWVNSFPFYYGAGGGYSEIFGKPFYQRGVVSPDPTGGRAVPDVGMVGDPTTGMLVGETQDFDLPSRYGPVGVHYGEYRIGGTSLSSPLMAGVQAAAEGSSRIGFANPSIYALYKRGVYYDVTPQGDLGNVRSDYANGENADDGIIYSLRTFDQDSSLQTDRGWDDVTGVGAPTSRYFDGMHALLH